MRIQPLDDRIVVKPLDLEEKKVGSIYVPETAKEKPVTGKVVAIGTDEELQEIIKEGDTVIVTVENGRMVFTRKKETKAKVGSS